MFLYSKSKGIGSNIIEDFSKIFPNYCHLSFDSFFGNKNNLQFLDKENIFFTVTFLSNKRGFPNFKNTNLKLGQIYKEKENNTNYIAY